MTRTRIGTIVQTTSMAVLWVVFDGSGFAFALNRIMMINRRARTKIEIAVMITSSRLSKLTRSSITGLTES